MTPSSEDVVPPTDVAIIGLACRFRSTSDDIDVERAFQDLDFDSMTGVELLNRPRANTGLALSRILIWDYPNATAMADHLAQQLLGGHREESGDEKIWSALRKIPLEELRRTGLLDKLFLLAGMPEKSGPAQLSATT